MNQLHALDCMGPPVILHAELPSTSTQEERGGERDKALQMHNQASKHDKCAKQTIAKNICTQQKLLT